MLEALERQGGVGAVKREDLVVLAPASGFQRRQPANARKFANWVLRLRDGYRNIYRARLKHAIWSLGSAGEHRLHTAGVTGSNPVATTMNAKPNPKGSAFLIPPKVIIGLSESEGRFRHRGEIVSPAGRRDRRNPATVVGAGESAQRVAAQSKGARANRRSRAALSPNRWVGACSRCSRAPGIPR